ncbi:M48 family metallopeptidase [Peribacillus tepidiphilus]|uniref:M48 family metallopeptidase n=1 Tax=Peribacillus tepidiphilus TaxID=2652445 RepID=UPI0012911BCD|nr:M48 family metallopeptidase [Peribacillus tepidiphilus]
MARKLVFYSVLVYLFIAGLLYMYIFKWADTSIPASYKGSSADPRTFMNGRELLLSEEYSEIRNYLFFLSTPYEWLFYLIILVAGFSVRFEKSSSVFKKIGILNNAIYLFWLSIVSYLVVFPFNYAGYYLSKKYNISTQSFSSWMKDEVIDFWVNFGLMIIIVSVLYWLMKKSAKRWWLYAWMLSVPFTLFLMFVQPVLIDPLYNDFYPLKNKVLEEKILELAEEAKIPADHVYEVNMAEKTNSMNAYVTGIGSNSRIVLWDTTLNKLSEDEILFIMAHEMAHYVEKHIYIGIAGYLLLTLVGLWLTSKLMNVMIRKWGGVLNISSISRIQSLPLFLLIISVLLFASSPITNAVSRHQERRADAYAIEMTKDKKAAVSTFQELSKAGLSQVNPPLLVKIFRYSHPTMLERISTLEQYDEKQK